MFGDYAGVFAAVGVLSLSYIALRALYTLWRGIKLYLLSPVLGLGVDVKCLGQWAGTSAYLTSVSRLGWPSRVCVWEA